MWLVTLLYVDLFSLKNRKWCLYLAQNPSQAPTEMCFFYSASFAWLYVVVPQLVSFPITTFLSIFATHKFHHYVICGSPICSSKQHQVQFLDMSSLLLISSRPSGDQEDGGKAGAGATGGASASTHASRARAHQRPSRPGTAPPGTTRAGSKSSRSESVHPVSDTAGGRPWKNNSEWTLVIRSIARFLTIQTGQKFH